MESNLTSAEKPFRVGVFATIEQADRAVAGLLAAGFTKDHISVVCSDKVIEQQFPSRAVPFMDSWGCLVFIVLFIAVVTMAVSLK